MPAIHVAQAPCFVVVFSKEERGVRALGCILVKELVHQSQQALRVTQSDCTLAAQIRLQIGHQKCGGDSFARDVADY